MRYWGYRLPQFSTQSIRFSYESTDEILKKIPLYRRVFQLFVNCELEKVLNLIRLGLGFDIRHIPLKLEYYLVVSLGLMPNNSY